MPLFPTLRASTHLNKDYSIPRDQKKFKSKHKLTDYEENNKKINEFTMWKNTKNKFNKSKDATINKDLLIREDDVVKPFIKYNFL